MYFEKKKIVMPPKKITSFNIPLKILIFNFLFYNVTKEILPSSYLSII